MDIEQIKELIGAGFSFFGAAVALASIIVKITPTQEDDKILAKIVKVFDQLSIFNPKGTEVVKKDENK